MNTSSSIAEGDEAKERSPWNGFLMGVFMCLIVRHVSNNYQSWWNGEPPAKVPVLSVVDRSHATLAYWNTTVRNLHEVRFKVTPSERPSEQVWNEFVSQLKVLSDQANVAPWNNVDQELVQMVIRHSVIDGKVFQFKSQMDEWRKQNPVSSENSVSLNEAMAQWQQIMAAVEADADILKKLPEGPVRKIIESAVEYEQLALDQRYEIEAMQSTLQKRYPGTEFPLPDIGE